MCDETNLQWCMHVVASFTGPAQLSITLCSHAVRAWEQGYACSRLREEYSMIHSSFSCPNLHLSELQLSESSLIRTRLKYVISINIMLCIKWKGLCFVTNSIVSLIWRFQLSEHPLVPVCLGKWLPTAHALLAYTMLCSLWVIVNFAKSC